MIGSEVERAGKVPSEDRVVVSDEEKEEEEEAEMRLSAPGLTGGDLEETEEPRIMAF